MKSFNKMTKTGSEITWVRNNLIQAEYQKFKARKTGHQFLPGLIYGETI